MKRIDYIKKYTTGHAEAQEEVIQTIEKLGYDRSEITIFQNIKGYFVVNHSHRQYCLLHTAKSADTQHVQEASKEASRMFLLPGNTSTKEQMIDYLAMREAEQQERETEQQKREEERQKEKEKRQEREEKRQKEEYQTWKKLQKAGKLYTSTAKEEEEEEEEEEKKYKQI